MVSTGAVVSPRVPGVVSADPGAVCGESLPVPGGVVSADPGAVCGESLPVPGGVVSADPGAVCGESLPVPGVVSADPGAVCSESLSVPAVAVPSAVCHVVWSCSLPGVVCRWPARVSGVVTSAACVSESKLFWVPSFNVAWLSRLVANGMASRPGAKVPANFGK